MIRLSLLRSCRLSDAQQGELYLSRTAGFENFLVGTVQGAAVAILLDGEKPFYFYDLHDWEGRKGLAVPNPRILVDVESSKIVGEGVPFGTLIVDNLGVRVVGYTNTGRDLVTLSGEPRDQIVSASAFLSWKIVAEGENGDDESNRR